MNVRLIKPGMTRTNDKQKQPPAEVPILETLRSWVRDFQSTRTDRARLDFKRIRNAGKT